MRDFIPDFSLSKQQVLDRISDSKENIRLHSMEVSRLIKERNRILNLLSHSKEKVAKCDRYRMDLENMLKNEKYAECKARP